MSDSINELNSMVPDDIEGKLHWYNSSNVLCNYMKKREYLEAVLKNGAIIPRYVIEPIDYLDLKDYRKICFPMTCFCDIPFSKAVRHMTNYGGYGIGLDKKAVLKKYHVQPIQYINGQSPLAKDFKMAFLASINEHFTGEANKLAGYLASSLMYMKPIYGYKEDYSEEKQVYVFQDECEWRYIPSENFPKELHLILKQQETTERAREKYSDVLKNHPECWLRFEWEDLRYIIVPNEIEAEWIIKAIRGLGLDDKTRDILISKIEISNRFSDNM